MGGEASGEDELRRAVRERAERGAAVVKIMASGGVMTPGTDMLAGPVHGRPSFAPWWRRRTGIGLPVTAHAHALPAVERSAAAGVDGIEHCSCLTADGSRRPPELLDRLRSDRHLRLSHPRAGCRASSRRPGCRQRSRPRMRPTSSTSRTSPSSAAPALVLLAGTDAGIGPSKRHGLVPMGDRRPRGRVRHGPHRGPGGGHRRRGPTPAAWQRRTGRLAAGLDADLLVVDGDALTDVTALQRPRLVLSRGRAVPLDEPAP